MPVQRRTQKACCVDFDNIVHFRSGNHIVMGSCMVIVCPSIVLALDEIGFIRPKQERQRIGANTWLDWLWDDGNRCIDAFFWRCKSAIISGWFFIWRCSIGSIIDNSTWGNGGHRHLIISNGIGDYWWSHIEIWVGRNKQPMRLIARTAVLSPQHCACSVQTIHGLIRLFLQ